MDIETAKAAIEVTAGLIPMQPIPELTRQWFITSVEWEQAREQTKEANEDDSVVLVDHVGRLLTNKQGQAMAYAQLLMLQPDRYNFVRVDWIWF